MASCSQIKLALICFQIIYIDEQQKNIDFMNHFKQQAALV